MCYETSQSNLLTGFEDLTGHEMQFRNTSFEIEILNTELILSL